MPTIIKFHLSGSGSGARASTQFALINKTAKLAGEGKYFANQIMILTGRRAQPLQ